jgi:surface polysaccharide O-acyltransferase-like enzyme
MVKKMAQGERIFGLDLLKALAAFFVVLYHVRLVDFGYQEGVYYYPTFIQVLWLFCACGVPLFFMINGALTIYRHYDMRKTVMKVGRLLLVALFWGIISLLVYNVTHDDKKPFIIDSLFYYWFLFSLAVFYLISFVLGRLPDWCRRIVVATLLIFPFMTNMIWDFIILFIPEMTRPSWGHIGLFTMYGLVYLYAGDYLMHHRCNKLLVILGGIIGLALLSIEATAVVNNTHAQFEGGNYCFPTVGALLLSVALFALLKDWSVRCSFWKHIITFLGNNALGIYIFHLLLMVVLGFVIRTWFPNLDGYTVHPIMAVLIAFVYMFVSAAISELIRRSSLRFLLKL